jgi:hypothetical protein
METDLLSRDDCMALLDMSLEQNGTLAAIWEAYQIMKDKEDHLDSLQVFLKVKEQAVVVESNRISN